MNRRFLNTPHKAAFTLLEILLATAITAILVVLLMAVIQNVLGIYSRMTGDPEMTAESRLAVRQLTRDLESLALQGDSKGETLRMTPEPNGSIGLIGGESAVWLTFLSSATDRDNSEPTRIDGSVRSVSYRLAYQNPIDDSNSQTDPEYALYRSIASAAHTLDNSLGKTNLQANYWAALPPSPSPTPLPPTAIDNYLAGGVVGFQVRFQYLDQKGTSDPEDDTFEWTKPGDTVLITGQGGEVNGTRVTGGFQRAEITLTVLSRQGRILFEDNILSLDEAIKRHGRTEVAQVVLSMKQ